MRFKSNLETHTEHLDLRCEYEPYVLPNTKIGTAKDYGKNNTNNRPPVVRHLLRNCIWYDLTSISRTEKPRLRLHEISAVRFRSEQIHFGTGWPELY